MNKDQKLVAFDFRIDPFGKGATVDNSWPEHPILPSQVRKALSADEAIWPEIGTNDYDELLGRIGRAFNWPYDSKTYCDSNSLLPNIPSSWIRMDDDWSDKKCWLIAFSVSEKTVKYLIDLKQHELRFYVSSISVAVLRESNWQFLGYDVTDLMHYSGLVNTTFRNDERIDLMKRYGETLNEFGLFTDLSQAEQFAKESDKRIPDHAPFFGMGIWVHPRTIISAGEK